MEYDDGEDVYRLANIEWNRGGQDFNADSIGSFDLLYEYVDLLNYYEPASYVRVTKSHKIKQFQYPSLSYNISIPYPYYIITDEGYHVQEIKYFNTTIRDADLREDFSTSVHLEFKNQPDVFLSTIQNMHIKDASSHSLSVRLDCTLFSATDGNEYFGTLMYNFIKEE